MIWFLKLIRTFFFAIDSVLYNFIVLIYNLIMLVAQTSILSQANIQYFAGRIQMLLAVFMLFKVSFSIITYIVNPDDFSDKSKGFGKLWQNAIISLVLLVLVPYVFNLAYQLQGIILRDNSLMTLLFGEQVENNSNFTNEGGQMLAYSVMAPFFSLKTSEVSTSSSNGWIITDSNVDLSACDQGLLLQDNSGEKLNNECLNALSSALSSGDEKNNESDVNVLLNYAYGTIYKNYNMVFRLDAAKMTADGDRDFVFDYKVLLSTICAVVVLLILITFLLDIALRSIKLAFLQFIAPIPIISYMDPKGGKDGIFAKWYKMCFSTYLSLFIRLFALYFGIYLISIIIKTGPTYFLTGETVDNLWIKLLLILGVLMFIKQFPKILESLGVKLDGGGKFTLNPFKKIENEAIGGKQLLGATGAMVSSVADRGARIMTAQGAANKLKAAAGGLVGIPGAALRGARNGKGFSSGMKVQNTVNRRLRDGRIKGLSTVQSYLDYAGSMFGLDDATLERESRINYQNETTLKDMERRATEVSRAETLEATKLEHDNAQRKETLQRFSDAQSKGETLKKFSEDFTKKKANFGEDVLSSFDKTVLADLLRFKGNSIGNNITLSDGHVIKAGRTIDDDMIEEVKNRGNYAANIKADNYNLELLKGLKLDTPLDKDIQIGSKVFEKGTIVNGQMLQQADQAAYEYEKYSIKQVQNLFASGDVEKINNAFANDQREFNAKSSEYVTSVSNVNESVDAYNKTYGTSITEVSDNVTFDALDSAIKDYISSDVVRDMRTDSAAIESQIAQHKQNAATAKDKITGHLLDEKGKVVIDSVTGLAKEYGIDEFKSVHTPRKEANERAKKQHEERRSMMANLNNKG